MESQTGKYKQLKIIVLAVVFIGAVGILGIYLLSGSTPKGAPKISLSEDTHDFGNFSEEQSVSHTFVIHNTGESPLEISKVKSDCDCTVPNYDKSIPPGGRGKITLTLKPFTLTDAFEKHSTVFTNDPDKPQVVLTVQGVSEPKPQVSKLTQSEMHVSKELERIFDIQVPGWQRELNPLILTQFRDDKLLGFSVEVRFKSGNRAIHIFSICPMLDFTDKLILDRMAKIPREHAQMMQIKDFEAIMVTPLPNQYETFSIHLYINVGNRSMVQLWGDEVMESEILLKAANLIDLKKLAAIPN